MSETNTTYLVQLTPLDKYFFGGERTFGKDGNQNYLIHSNLYPQQTGLLGLCRQIMLESKGLLSAPEWKISNANEAAALIGPQSFTVNDDGSLNDFGKISCISPLFLVVKNRNDKEQPEILLPAPLDYHLAYDVDSDLMFQPAEFNNQKPRDIKIGGNTVGVFNTKGGLYNGWLGNEEKEYKTCELFTDAMQTGVYKKGTGAAGEEAYFKQFYYKFSQKDKSFACYLKLKQAMNELDGYTTIINFGRERMPFKVELKKLEEGEQTKDLLSLMIDVAAGRFKANPKTFRLVLLSDTYIANPDEAYNEEGLLHVTADNVSFRSLYATVRGTTRYGGVSKKQDSKKLIKRGRYNLLTRGSSFYFSSEDAMKKFIYNHIACHREFIQAGFNYYYTIKEN